MWGLGFRDSGFEALGTFRIYRVSGVWGLCSVEGLGFRVRLRSEIKLLLAGVCGFEEADVSLMVCRSF